MITPNTGDSTVILTIPMRAEYVSIARLTAAGVANRLGFDIETIEDIKVSLSEVCNRIIGTQNKLPAGNNAECKIEFILAEKSLSIDFFVDNIESYNFYVPDNASVQNGLGGAGNHFAKEGLAPDRQFDDSRRLEEQYEDQLQLSLITLLMDEFVVNPSENCLVSMKKYLD